MAYLTFEDLAIHLGILVPSENSDVDALERAVNSAIEAVGDYCARQFVVADGSTTRVFRVESGCVASIDDATTVTLVETSTDGQTWVEASGWWAEPLNAAADGMPFDALHSDTGWSAWVRVTGTFGWAAIPSRVVSATLLKAAKLYKRKDSPTGVEGADGFVVSRVSRYEDGDVQMLLNKLRRGDKVFGIA